MSSKAWIRLLLVGVLAAGCGGNVVVEDPQGGAGGAPSSSSADSGGGEAVACGARLGDTCNAGEVCDWADDSCGVADGYGTCAPRPEGCPKDCPGVCGCDGKFYCNSCSAHSAGVDVSALASCSREGREYSAIYLPGGLDHVIIRKADIAEDRCVMLFIDWPTESTPAFAISLPSGWGASRAVVTHRADDCAGDPGATLGEAAEVDGGAGFITWEVLPDRVVPCRLGLDVALKLASPPPWAPPEERLVADAVHVDGSCNE